MNVFLAVLVLALPVLELSGELLRLHYRVLAHLLLEFLEVGPVAWDPASVAHLQVLGEIGVEHGAD